MEKNYFDREKIGFGPLAGRRGAVDITQRRIVPTDTAASLPPLSEDAMRVISRTARDILEAKEKGASRILTFGTYLIENGLGALVGDMARRGWLTHLATTGTPIVDDWEFAFHGTGCEDSREELPHGKFGMWRETGFYINLAILVGAWNGEGLGEAVGKMIGREEIRVPDRETLLRDMRSAGNPDKAAAAADLLDKIERYGIREGSIRIRAPFRQYSLQYLAYLAEIPFTVHPMFGLDVLFMHPVNSFAAVGHCAESDFLRFVASVDNMEDGIYLSVGSSIASPMIYEKALSMSQNVRIPAGRRMERHKIVVVDLAESKWDWLACGEPPEDRPEYYLRYCKSFSRAKAMSMYYVSADNRDFFLHLYRELDTLDT